MILALKKQWEKDQNFETNVLYNKTVSKRPKLWGRGPSRH